MNSVHEQCKSTVVQTVAHHSTVCHKTTLSCHASRCACCRTLCVRARSRHRPNNPALSQHQKTVSRRRTSQLCRDRENSVATDFSFTLKRRCHDTKSHITTQNQTHEAVPLSRDQKPQLPNALSRHKVSQLFRDREPKEVCRDRPSLARPHAQVLVRAPDVPDVHTTPLLSQHHCSVATQNWKWAVAHPI